MINEKLSSKRTGSAKRQESLKKECNNYICMTSLPKTARAFIWHFIKPYKWILFVVCVVFMALSIAHLLDQYLLKLFINKVSSYQDPGNLLEDSSILTLIVLFTLVHLVHTGLWRVID